MMIEELKCVALTVEIPFRESAFGPDRDLRRGEVGTVVFVHNAGEAYEVEFIEHEGVSEGETIGVVTLYPDQIRLVDDEEARSGRLAGVDAVGGHAEGDVS